MVQEMRKSFLAVKQKLRAMDVKYMLLYPAKLQVIHKGQSHFFERPEEVWQWPDMADQMPVGLEAGGGAAIRTIRSKRRRADRGGGSDNRNRHSSDTRFVVQEDGTLSTSASGNVLVLDTLQSDQQGEAEAGCPQLQGVLTVPETGTTPSGMMQVGEPLE